MPGLRVVHVLHALATGGMEKGVVTLARNASPDIEHAIVCLTTSGAMARQLPEGTTVIEMHKPRGNSVRFLRRLAAALRDLEPDVLHTRNWGGMDAVIAARLAGLRSVVHGEHGWGMADSQGQSPWRRRVRRLLARWTREFTCVSRDIENWLQRDIGVRRPVTQIYNGVDPRRFAPDSSAAGLRVELGIESEAFVVGVVGRLDPIKDHGTLFRAFRTLRATGIPAELLVVGPGPEEGKLREISGERIRFLGDRADVPAILRTLDVFVLPSLNEGISNTILEAMATALPVVATRVGGNPELVVDGSTGVLVEVGDDDAIAKALIRYSRSPDLANLHGAAARDRVLDQFSILRMVEQYEQVWRRVGCRDLAGATVAK